MSWRQCSKKYFGINSKKYVVCSMRLLTNSQTQRKKESMNDQTKKQGAAHWTDAQFEEELKKAAEAKKPVVVDFFATWCGPCRLAAPVIDKLADEYADQVTIVKMDVDENNMTPAKFGVMSIPTVIAFKDGEPVDKIIGFPGEPGYRKLIDKVAG